MSPAMTAKAEDIGVSKAGMRLAVGIVVGENPQRLGMLGNQPLRDTQP